MTADITATVKYGAPYNPEFTQSTGYTVTLHRKGRRMTVPFYMGIAHTAEPTVRDVMECLASDATSGELSFEEFCRDLGYDEDSRRAERVWKSVVSQTKKLRKFLGEDFDAIVYPDWSEADAS